MLYIDDSSSVCLPLLGHNLKLLLLQYINSTTMRSHSEVVHRATILPVNGSGLTVVEAIEHLLETAVPPLHIIMLLDCFW